MAFVSALQLQEEVIRVEYSDVVQSVKFEMGRGIRGGCVGVWVRQRWVSIVRVVC